MTTQQLTADEAADELLTAFNNSHFAMHFRDIAQVADACKKHLGKDTLQARDEENGKSFLLRAFSAHKRVEVPLALLAVLAETNPERLAAEDVATVKLLKEPDLAELVSRRFPAMTGERLRNAVAKVELSAV